jgi:hypothetical protein
MGFEIIFFEKRRTKPEATRITIHNASDIEHRALSLVCFFSGFQRFDGIEDDEDHAYHTH